METLVGAIIAIAVIVSGLITTVTDAKPVQQPSQPLTGRAMTADEIQPARKAQPNFTSTVNPFDVPSNTTLEVR